MLLCYDKNLNKTKFSANLRILGKKELLKPEQISDLVEYAQSLGQKNDVIEVNIGSKILDTYEKTNDGNVSKILSGYKMSVKDTFTNLKNFDLSTADTQQKFWNNYNEISPYGVIKKWLSSVKNNTKFNPKKININPKLYNAKNNDWVDKASFVVPKKKTGNSKFKIDIYKFQDLYFSKSLRDKNYKEIIELSSENKEKIILPKDIINNLTLKEDVSKKELLNRITKADTYNTKVINDNQQTQKLYSDCKGIYNSERIILHNKILDEIFVNSNNAKPKTGLKPTFIMLGGRGGSGKTKFGKNGEANVYNSNSYIVLNTDEIKKRLPEYKGFNAYEVHEESCDILNRALDISMQKKLNVVLDGTMSDFNYCEKTLKQFTETGYNIEMYYMYLPREKAAERAMLRFNYNGRYVPLDVLLKMINNEANFDKLKSYASKYAFYNNDVKLDNEPVLVNFGGPELFEWVYRQCKYEK